jgi:hypothetical protein
VSTDLKDKVIAALRDVDPNASDFRSQAWDKLRIQFERAPNPMFPWSALRWARDSGSDIPEWIIDYFYDKAVKLTEIVAEDAKREAREVGRALGFGAGGKGSPAAGAKLRQQWRDFEIAVHVADLMRQGVTKETAAIAETAKALSVSPATAHRAHVVWSDMAAQFVSHGMHIS